jgi:hypothetical protein
MTTTTTTPAYQIRHGGGSDGAPTHVTFALSLGDAVRLAERLSAHGRRAVLIHGTESIEYVGGSSLTPLERAVLEVWPDAGAEEMRRVIDRALARCNGTWSDRLACVRVAASMHKHGIEY